MPKRPAFTFYPGDWLRNEVAGAPLEAQGLWLRMMIVMHDAEVYGELSIAGKPMSDEYVASKCGISARKYRKNLKFLDDFRVINRNADGVIFSGRMQRDEAERAANAKRQRDFYDRHNIKPNAEPNGTPNTPSSSSSSFSNKKIDKPKGLPIRTAKKNTRLPEPFMLTKDMKEWAAEKNITINLIEHTEAFVDHFRGTGATKADWVATWRNWMRRANKEQFGKNWSNNRNGSNQNPDSKNNLDAEARLRSGAGEFL